MKINANQLSKKAKSPIFSYCRKLMAQGVDPQEPLEIYRNSPDWDVRVNSIEEGAKLGVFEGIRHGPTFVKFKEWCPSSLTDKKKKLEGDV